jgi:serine/threonine-protein kinase
MVDSVPPPFQIGALIAGKYRVERVLGKGGMGTVVAARHVELDELRAVKLMNPADLRNANAVERFRREARSAARLRSEHAARIFDIETPGDGAAFIVMEYLEGMDLHALLFRKGAQRIDLAVLYIVQTALS